jgi:hypothetical protein
MKKKLLVASLFVSMILSAQVPTASLSAYYPFNGNTNDYAGTRHGVPAGTAQYGIDRFGNANGCYDVIGNANHIMLPNDTWIKGDYSISAWVKIKSVESYPRLYDFSNGYTVNNVLGKLSHSNSGKPSVEICNTGSSCAAYFTNTNLAVGTWYHLVFIVSGNQFKMYINNALTGTYTSSVVPQNVFRTKNKIGGSNAPAQDNTKAYIDDFRLYDRAITPEEVSALYNEPNTFVGINEIENTIDQLSVFPNPATNDLSVSFVSRTDEKARVHVYDNLGKVIYSYDFETVTGSNDIKVNTQDFASGFYYISVSNASGIRNVKFVKN